MMIIITTILMKVIIIIATILIITIMVKMAMIVITITESRDLILLQKSIGNPHINFHSVLSVMFSAESPYSHAKLPRNKIK